MTVHLKHFVICAMHESSVYAQLCCLLTLHFNFNELDLHRMRITCFIYLNILYISQRDCFIIFSLFLFFKYPGRKYRLLQTFNCLVLLFLVQMIFRNMNTFYTLQQRSHCILGSFKGVVFMP